MKEHTPNLSKDISLPTIGEYISDTRLMNHTDNRSDFEIAKTFESITEIKDGVFVRIRPIQESDRKGIETLYANMPKEDVYNRFFAPVDPRHAGRESLKRSALESPNSIDFVAVRVDPDTGEEISSPIGTSGVISGPGLYGEKVQEAHVSVAANSQKYGAGALLLATAIEAGTYDPDVDHVEIITHNPKVTKIALRELKKHGEYTGKSKFDIEEGAQVHDIRASKNYRDFIRVLTDRVISSQEALNQESNHTDELEKIFSRD